MKGEFQGERSLSRSWGVGQRPLQGDPRGKVWCGECGERRQRGVLVTGAHSEDGGDSGDQICILEKSHCVQFRDGGSLNRSRGGQGGRRLHSRDVAEQEGWI